MTDTPREARVSAPAARPMDRGPAGRRHWQQVHGRWREEDQATRTRAQRPQRDGCDDRGRAVAEGGPAARQGAGRPGPGSKSRHYTMRDHVWAAEVRRNEPGVELALNTLYHEFVITVGPDRVGGEPEALAEFERMCSNAEEPAGRRAAGAARLARPQTDFQRRQTTGHPAAASSVGVDLEGFWELTPTCDISATSPTPGWSARGRCSGSVWRGWWPTSRRPCSSRRGSGATPR